MHKFLTFLTMVLISFSSVNGAVTPARRPGGISFTGGSTTVQAKPVAGTPNTNGGAMIGNAMRTTSGGLGVSVGSGLRKIGTGATIDRQSNPNSGSVGCSSDQHMEDGSCVPNTYNENCDGLNGYGVKHCDTENGCDGVCVLNECKSGYYLIDGKCTSCPAGSYCDGGVAQPVQCLANTYSEAGSGGCMDCPSGTKSNAGAQSESQCIPITCDAGEFLDGDECVLCPVGSYCTGGVTKSVVCPIGKYAAVGASECTSCPKDMTTSAEGAGAKSECVRTRCDEPTYYLDGGACYKCPAGYECNGTASMTRCSANTYAPSGSGVCKPCDTGMTSEAGAAICHGSDGNSNVVGNNNGDTGGTGASASNKCTSGYYSDSSLSGGCGICPRGYSCDGSASMTRCDKGTYAGVGAAKCEKCPEGTTTSGGGAATVLECISTTPATNGDGNTGGGSQTVSGGDTESTTGGNSSQSSGSNASNSGSVCNQNCSLSGRVCLDGECVYRCKANFFLGGTSCSGCGANTSNPADNLNRYCTCNPGYTADGSFDGPTITSSVSGCLPIRCMPSCINGQTCVDGVCVGGDVSGTCRAGKYMRGGVCVTCPENSSTNDNNIDTMCRCNPGYTADGKSRGSQYPMYGECVALASTTTCIPDCLESEKCENGICVNDEDYYSVICGTNEYNDGKSCLPCGANSTNPNNNGFDHCTCSVGYVVASHNRQQAPRNGEACVPLDDSLCKPGCTNGQMCKNGVCVDDIYGGQRDSTICSPECTDNKTCVGGECVCLTGTNMSTALNPDIGLCSPGRCGANSDCPNGQTCTSGGYCYGDMNCAEDCASIGKVCKGGVCVGGDFKTPHKCSALPCSPSETCVNGYCTMKNDGTCNPGCVSGQTCNNGICNYGDGTCTEACGVNERCEDGVCRSMVHQCSTRTYFDGDSCELCGANSVSTNGIDGGYKTYCNCISGYTANGKADGATTVTNGDACFSLTTHSCDPGCTSGQVCGSIDFSKPTCVSVTGCHASYNCSPGNVCGRLNNVVNDNRCTTCTNGQVWSDDKKVCVDNFCTGENEIYSDGGCRECNAMFERPSEDHLSCEFFAVCEGENTTFNYNTKECETLSCPAPGKILTVTKGFSTGGGQPTLRNCCATGVLDSHGNCCASGAVSGILPTTPGFPGLEYGNEGTLCLPSKNSTITIMGSYDHSGTYGGSIQTRLFCIDGTFVPPSPVAQRQEWTLENPGTCEGGRILTTQSDPSYLFASNNNIVYLGDGVTQTLSIGDKTFIKRYDEKYDRIGDRMGYGYELCEMFSGYHTDMYMCNVSAGATISYD